MDFLISFFLFFRNYHFFFLIIFLYLSTCQYHIFFIFTFLFLFWSILLSWLFSFETINPILNFISFIFFTLTVAIMSFDLFLVCFFFLFEFFDFLMRYINGKIILHKAMIDSLLDLKVPSELPLVWAHEWNL